jgi:hypothetical protein
MRVLVRGVVTAESVQLPTRGMRRRESGTVGLAGGESCVSRVRSLCGREGDAFGRVTQSD